MNFFIGILGIVFTVIERVVFVNTQRKRYLLMRISKFGVSPVTYPQIQKTVKTITRDEIGWLDEAGYLQHVMEQPEWKFVLTDKAFDYLAQIKQERKTYVVGFLGMLFAALGFFATIYFQFHQ